MASAQLTAPRSSSDTRKVERTANPSRPVVYVNNTVVETSQVDVQLYFSFIHEVTPGKFASVEQLLVVMAPEHALQVFGSLKKHWTPTKRPMEKSAKLSRLYRPLEKNS